MDRLQIAIEKARRSRIGLIAAAPATPGLPRLRPAALGGTGQAGTLAGSLAGNRAAGLAAGSAAALAQSPAAAWAALAPLVLDAPRLARARLVARDAGPEAAPYDLLRTRILQETARHGWRRIALVAPHAGCGATTAAANLALAFARQSDRRLLLLDLNFRTPGLARLFGQTRDSAAGPQAPLAAQSSMADVLDASIPFADHGRRLGTAVALGLTPRPVAAPAERLQAQTTADALARLDAAYAPDLTLFDLAPLSAGDDAIGFLKSVDCAIILAQAEKTPTAQIDHAERTVATLTNVLGIVLTQCKYPE